MGSLKLEKVEKWFGEAQIIKGIDLEISDGEFVIFVGPSGCGKSTLLRMIAGLEETSRGKIFLDGSDVTEKPPSERQLSMVFQSYALYPHMTVRENVGFGLKTAKEPKDEIERKVNAAAKTLGLGEYLDRYPKLLSGGQRQRVAIGRAIVREPKGFLFDEPLSNLDAALRVQMRFEIAKLHAKLRTTIVYVTHDQVEAMTLADRIVVLNDGQIMQVGTPRELYERPANRFVAQFIGSPKMNIMPCTVTRQKFMLKGQRSGKCSIQGESEKIIEIAIRPEHISFVRSEESHCSGRVEISEYLGSDIFHYVDCGELGLLTVRTNGSEASHKGKVVNLKFSEDHLHFFDRNGERVSNK